jgi:hypothetical protein
MHTSCPHLPLCDVNSLIAGVAVGRRQCILLASRFILRPAVPSTDWTAELETLAVDILEYQT